MHSTRFLKNVLLNLSGQVLPALAGLATVPFMIRKLGMEEFGIFSLAYTILVALTLFDFGMSRATTHAVASAFSQGRTDLLSGLVWTSLIVHVSLGGLGGVFLFLSAPVLVKDFLTMSPSVQKTAISAFQVVALALPFVLAHTVLKGILEAVGRFGLVNLIKIPLNSLIFLLPAILLSFEFGLPSLINSLLILQVLAGLSYLFLSIRALPWFDKAPLFKPAFIPQLMAFGRWVALSAVIGPIIVYIDRFFLGKLISISAIPFYVVPYEAVTRLWIIPTAVTLVLFPAVSALKTSTRDGLTGPYVQSVKHLFLTMAPIVLMLIVFSHPLLGFIFGEEFAVRSDRVFQILALGVLINSLAWVPYAFLQGMGRPDLSAKLHLIELPIHVLFSWFLIKNMGLPGAALAWTIRATIDTILLFYVSIKKLDFSSIGVAPLFSQCGMAFAAFAVPILFVPLFGASFLWQLLLVLFLIFGYVWVLWSWVLDSAEQKSVRNVISRFQQGKETISHGC